jgi:hypothetical protein
MPAKDSRLDDYPATKVLPLQDWLKLLSSRGVDMRVAMALAAKMCAKSILPDHIGPAHGTGTTAITRKNGSRGWMRKS